MYYVFRGTLRGSSTSARPTPMHAEGKAALQKNWIGLKSTEQEGRVRADFAAPEFPSCKHSGDLVGIHSAS